jgi:hypothetical protein
MVCPHFYSTQQFVMVVVVVVAAAAVEEAAWAVAVWVVVLVPGGRGPYKVKYHTHYRKRGIDRLLPDKVNNQKRYSTSP